jgi:hypothetical protein
MKGNLYGGMLQNLQLQRGGWDWRWESQRAL